MKTSNSQCSGVRLTSSLSKVCLNPLSPSLGSGFMGQGSNDWTLWVAKHIPHSLCFNTSLIHQVQPPQATKNEVNEIKLKKEREYFYSSFNSWSSSKGPHKSYCLQRKRWDTLPFCRNNHLICCVTFQNHVYPFTWTIHTQCVKGGVFQLHDFCAPCLLPVHSKMSRAGRGHTPTALTSAWLRGHLRSSLEWESFPNLDTALSLADVPLK